jgi:hypothetical protein
MTAVFPQRGTEMRESTPDLRRGVIDRSRSEAAPISV